MLRARAFLLPAAKRISADDVCMDVMVGGQMQSTIFITANVFVFYGVEVP